MRERRPALAVERPEFQPFDRVGLQDGVERVRESVRGRRRSGHGNEGESLPLGRGGPDQEVEERNRQAVDPLQVVDGEDDLATSERGMGRLEEPDRLEWLSGLRSLPQQDPQPGSGPLAGQPPELDADGRQWDVALRLGARHVEAHFGAGARDGLRQKMALTRARLPDDEHGRR